MKFDEIQKESTPKRRAMVTAIPKGAIDSRGHLPSVKITLMRFILRVGLII